MSYILEAKCVNLSLINVFSLYLEFTINDYPLKGLSEIEISYTIESMGKCYLGHSYKSTVASSFATMLLQFNWVALPLG